MRHQNRHPRFVHADADAVASNGRLGDFKECAADTVTVADADFMVRQAFDREVFSKLTVAEVVAMQVRFPASPQAHQ
jgi:hypothetical protein